MIRLYKPSVGTLELNSIKKVFKRSWLGYGSEVKKFEKSWSKYCGSKYSIAVNSCTAALHLSLAAQNFKKRKKVLVPVMTFSATAAAILYCDLEPVFVDINKNDLNINYEDLKKKYSKDCVAVMVVHVGGHPCEMEKIVPWAKKKKLLVIEDCAHSAGSIYRGKMLGNWGDIGCFSFEDKKMITTGDGGMISTNKKKIAKRIHSLSYHGWDRDPWTRHKSSKTNTSTKKKHWFYQIKQLGFKYNMNDLMASIGIIQLKKLKRFNKLRNNAIKKYLNGIKNLKSISPSYPHINKNIAYWMFSIRVKQRDNCIEYLKKKKISTSVVWMPLNLHPIYKKYKYSTPNALKVWKELITLPLYSDIKKTDINFIVKCLKKFEKNLE